MTTTLTQIVNRVLLKDISWETYQRLVVEMESQPGTRLTYNQGLLEIMVPLDPHESYKYIISRFVDALTEELNIEIRGLGSRTCSREDLVKGLEPDSCFYIQNERLVRHKEQIDLNQDPPPDLAIEIDITSSSINRMAIYAALGVPEVWRYDACALTIYRLVGKEYQLIERSEALPLLTPSEVMRFLELKKTMGETSLIRSFRSWVRSQIKQ
jgi:Uma2 family endonuclease